MDRIEWSGLYAESWGNDLVPEAYAHPAKYSRGLIRQIYAYMLAEGMIAPGDVIGDPFGGQAGGALDAMTNGLHWRGVELEPRFVDLGNQNIELWNGRYAPHFERWGTAVLAQGDSRNFAGIVGGLSGAISSPPFLFNPSTGAKKGIDGYINDGQLPKMGLKIANDYGQTPGQLGSMKPGDLSAAISSPPYGDAINATTSGIDWGKAGRPDRLKPSPNRNNTMTDGVTSYGRSPGQVGRLDGVISSSPFESGLSADRVPKGERVNLAKKMGIPVDMVSAIDMEKIGQRTQEYGSTPGNTGNATGETFWTASRAIVEQVYAALKPGGYAAWVCGDFVRKGKRVYFGEQWLALCEACGFEPVTWAIAWKTEWHGTQTSLFGDVEMRTDRVSFFRRLANEKNPDAAVLNEDVIFVRRPM